MSTNHYDILIIGSGMAGLYTAYNIQKLSPTTSFLILEKHKKQWIGGRTSNETFYGTTVVTGAGIGRKNKDKLLIKLMDEIGIKYIPYETSIHYAQTFTPNDIVKTLKKLKGEYSKHPELHHNSFKEFFINTLGEDLYKSFIISVGYTDYENADVYETLYNYGMDDNKGGWTGLRIPWKEMVDRLYQLIGKNHFRFSSEVVEIKKTNLMPCVFQVKTEGGNIYTTNKVILATTISAIKTLVPGASSKTSLYQSIRGQPFLLLYAKFNKESSEIMKKYVPTYTIVPGPLQKIIPMNANKGVYMIAYSDNYNAVLQKKYLDNNAENRNLYCDLLETSLGIPKGQLTMTAMKDYYWPIGTHYYEPLQKEFKTRNEFIYKAQHPEKGMLVVGEVVSRDQGWTEGALESVRAVLTEQWIQTKC